MVIGIIVEYNPLHNGHLYHLNYVKEKYPEALIVAVMSGNFMQRGQISLINKFDKTNLALYYGVDLVVDLPVVYANEAADYFASNALKILNNFNVNKIVFGSENADLELYYQIANTQLYDDKYQQLVKQSLDEGLNYPTACSKALKAILAVTIKMPNDLLGISYVKAIVANNYDIEVDILARTNDFHSKEISKIASATSIRNAIINNLDYKIAVPSYTYDFLQTAVIMKTEDYFEILKYIIVRTSDLELAKIHLVEEGIQHRIKTALNMSSNYDELVKNIASKRFTYVKVARILINILINYTKEEFEQVQTEGYFRVLGFNKQGQAYLANLKTANRLYNVMFKTVDNTIARVEKRASMILALKYEGYSEYEPIIKQP